VTSRDRLLAALSPELVAALEELVADRVRQELHAARDEANAAWLTLEQAGELLDCTADAVRMRVKRGRLKARKQGRRLYVSAVSVERLA
jgi:Helix-turn-helix domain